MTALQQLLTPATRLRMLEVALSAADEPQFMTFEGVEIAHVGMEWPSASGSVTLTFEHLADAVAAQDDPHILPPRLKIGHEDPRFNEDPPVHDPFAFHGPLREDGNPVYGKATNLRLAEDGMVILGDYVDVPVWLGQSLPSAYPSRSLEGTWDVETQGGKRYSFVITAVALLGEPLPAITCLEDLVRELSGGPAAVAEQAPVTLNRKEQPMATSVALEASTDAVRAQFFDEFAQGDRYWWWPCELRVDEGWVLADDDEGHLYRVPFAINDDGIVAFGDPAAGVLDFRPIPDPEAGEQEAVAASRGIHFSSPQQAGRPQDRVRPAAAATTTGGARMEGATMTLIPLRERLGLPEDATEEQIQKAAAARLDELEAAAAEGEPAVEQPAPEPVAASADTVTVSREVWEQTNGRLETLEQRDAARTTAEAAARRDQTVESARMSGRIAPSECDHYRSMLEVDEEATAAILAQLTPGRVPVDERGSAAPASEDAGLDAVMASFGSSRHGGKEKS